VTTTTLTALIATAMLSACGADPAPASPPDAALAPAALAGRSLSAGSLPRMELLTTADGRDQLAHIVACALPRGASITAITRDGTPYSFTGVLGLAPSWAQHAPSKTEQHRVTACVLVQTVGLTRA
jgi:hypothetical protein